MTDNLAQNESGIYWRVGSPTTRRHPGLDPG
jgi:hypothetical protein